MCVAYYFEVRTDLTVGTHIKMTPDGRGGKNRNYNPLAVINISWVQAKSASLCTLIYTEKKRNVFSDENNTEHQNK